MPLVVLGSVFFLITRLLERAANRTPWSWVLMLGDLTTLALPVAMVCHHPEVSQVATVLWGFSGLWFALAGLAIHKQVMGNGHAGLECPDLSAPINSSCSDDDIDQFELRFRQEVEGNSRLRSGVSKLAAAGSGRGR